MTINSNYDKKNIIEILYKNRFQNYKVNRLLKASEDTLDCDLSFDGQKIICKIKNKEPFTVNLTTLASSKKLPTCSRIRHSFKGKAYNKQYRFRIVQLVHLSGAFDNLNPKNPISGSKDTKSLEFSLKKHPELKIRFFRFERKTSNMLHDAWIIFPAATKKYGVALVDFPKEGCPVFEILDQNTRNSGIDNKGFNSLKNEIFELTFELACGKYNSKQKDKSQKCKAKIEQLLKYTEENPILGLGRRDATNEILWYLVLLDYELEIVSNSEKSLVELQKPFEDILKNTLHSCVVRDGSPKFKIIFRKGNELLLDKENFSQHLEAFKLIRDGESDKDMQQTGVPVFTISDFLDLSKTSSADLRDEAINCLSLYFKKGDLSKNDLLKLQESELLQFFDLARNFTIFRLEALIGKEISDRLIGGTWVDSGLIRQRKGIQDALQPFVNLLA